MTAAPTSRWTWPSRCGLHMNNQFGDVNTPTMTWNEVKLEMFTLSDTDSSQDGDEFLPPPPTKAVDQEHEVSSSDSDDEGRPRRPRPKRRKKRSGGNRAPALKQKFVSIQKQNVLRHENLIEEFNHYWICEECGTYFYEKENLRAHLNTHFKRYYCKLCSEAGSDFVSVTLSEFRKHIRQSPCHRGNRTQTNAYNLGNAPGLDEADVFGKMDKNNFLTVEQLRNGNREKYDELKNLPVITLQELAGLKKTKTRERIETDTDDNDVAVPSEVETRTTSTVEPGESHQTPRVREKRKAAIEATRKIGDYYDPPGGPASRRRRFGRKKKNEMEMDASQFDEQEEAKRPDEVPAPGASIVAIAGPSQRVNQNESHFAQQPEEVSLTNAKVSEEKSNAAIEGKSAEDGGDASSEDAPLITDPDKGKGQSSSRIEGISHLLPASIASVREAATPLAEDSKEKLEKNKKKVKAKKGKKRKIPPRRCNLPSAEW